MKFLSAIIAAVALATYASAQETVQVERTIPPGGDVTILQYALTLEHLEATFYAQAIKRFSVKDFQRAGYPRFVYERVQKLAKDEENHVKFLQAGLSGVGATPVKPCTYNFPYKTVDEFLGLSRVLESVGVSAYLGAAKDISLADYVTAAGSILTVEARHQAVISEVTGQSGYPSAFDTPLGYSQVFTLASQFIVKCPPENQALPVTAFPKLTLVTKHPAAGDSIDFKFDPKGKKNGQLFLHVLNGLNDKVVPISARGHSRLPKGVSGTVYALVLDSEDYSDAAIIAGPAIIELNTADHWVVKSNKKHHRA